MPSEVARVPASSLTEEICDKAPLTDVVKGDMDSQSGENSSILSSIFSCLDGYPMSLSLFSNNRSGSLERRSHDCRHLPIATEPTGGEQCVPTERGMVGGRIPMDVVQEGV